MRTDRPGCIGSGSTRSPRSPCAALSWSTATPQRTDAPDLALVLEPFGLADLVLQRHLRVDATQPQEIDSGPAACGASSSPPPGAGTRAGPPAAKSSRGLTVAVSSGRLDRLPTISDEDHARPALSKASPHDDAPTRHRQMCPTPTSTRTPTASRDSSPRGSTGGHRWRQILARLGPSAFQQLVRDQPGQLCRCNIDVDVSRIRQLLLGIAAVSRSSSATSAAGR